MSTFEIICIAVMAAGALIACSGTAAYLIGRFDRKNRRKLSRYWQEIYRAANAGDKRKRFAIK